MRWSRLLAIASMLAVVSALALGCGRIGGKPAQQPAAEHEARQRTAGDSVARSFRVVRGEGGRRVYRFALAPTAGAQLIAARLTPGAGKSATFEIDAFEPGAGRTKTTIASGEDGLPSSITHSSGKSVYFDWSRWSAGTLGLRATASGPSTPVPLTPQQRAEFDRIVQQIRAARVDESASRATHAIAYAPERRVSTVEFQPIVRYVQLTDSEGKNRNLDSRVVTVSCSQPFQCQWYQLGAGGNYGVPVVLEFKRVMEVPEDTPGMERNTAACNEGKEEAQNRTTAVSLVLALIGGLTTQTVQPLAELYLGQKFVAELDSILVAVGFGQALNAVVGSTLEGRDCREAAINWVAEDLANDLKASASITICFETTKDPRARGCHRESGIVPAGDFQDKTVSLRLGETGAIPEPSCPQRFGLPLNHSTGIRNNTLSGGGGALEKSLYCTYQDTKSSDPAMVNRSTEIVLWWVETAVPTGFRGEFCAGADRVSQYSAHGGITRNVTVYSPDRLARGHYRRDQGMIADDEALRVLRGLVDQIASRSQPCPPPPTSPATPRR